jgi:hypothetical protein
MRRDEGKATAGMMETTTRRVLAATTAAAAVMALAGCSGGSTPGATGGSSTPTATATSVPDVAGLLSGGVLGKLTQADGSPAKAVFDTKGPLQVYSACTGGGQISVAVAGLSYKVTCDGKTVGSSWSVSDTAVHSYTLTITTPGNVLPAGLHYSVAVGRLN